MSEVDYLKEKGLSINDDGSTNNLNHFYWFSRDHICS